MDICPACGSGDIVRHSIRHNKHYDVQRYSCRSYKKWLSANLEFGGTHGGLEMVTNTMQLHFSGVSLGDSRGS